MLAALSFSSSSASCLASAVTRAIARSRAFLLSSSSSLGAASAFARRPSISAAAEIDGLRAKAEAAPKLLEEESKKARERAIARVTAEAKHEAELLEKESAANIEVFELKIKALDERITRQVAQLADLQKQLGTALEQGQNLAHKAIEGLSLIHISEPTRPY